MVGGDKVGAFALRESEAGSDASSIKTTARRDGNHYILKGTKIFIPCGDVCDVVLVMTNFPELGEQRATAFIVEEGTPGYRKGKKYDKVGMGASTNAGQIFEDCRIPAANSLGDECKRMRIFLEILDRGRIGIASQVLGIAQAMLDSATEYTGQRKQSGASIDSNHAVSFRQADLVTEIDAAHLLLHRVAFLAGTGFPFRRESSIAKVYCSELAMQAAVFGGQVFGGYGYMMDSLMQRHLGYAKLTRFTRVPLKCSGW